MNDDELRRALEVVALEAVGEGRLPEDGVLPGVRALDLWSEGPNGAMLFWIDRDATETPLEGPELQHVSVTRVAGAWEAMGSAISTVELWEEFRANVPPGLTRFMGGSAGFRDREDLVSWRSVRVTWATASPEVAAVRLHIETARFVTVDRGDMASCCWGSLPRIRSRMPARSTALGMRSPESPFCSERSCCR